MKNKSHFKLVILIQVFTLALVFGCSPTYDLSTPESSYNSYHMAIEQKDVNGMSRCLDLEGGPYTEQGVHALAEQLFNKTKTESHKVLYKDTITEAEADLIVEEILLKNNGVKAKSTARIKYIKIHDEWKAHSFENLPLAEVQ